MIIKLRDLAKCKRCGSSNTIAEMVVPSRRFDDLRGSDMEETVEVMCKECGKIDRRDQKIEIE